MASKKTASKPANPVSTGKTVSSKPAATKPKPAASAPSKKGSGKPTTGKSTTGKSAADKPSAVKPASTKPTVSKPTPSKAAPAKPAKTKPAAANGSATEKKAAASRDDSKPKKAPADSKSGAEETTAQAKKSSPVKKIADKPAETVKAGKSGPAPADDGDKKGPRKGITIVENRARPAKKPGIETKFALPTPTLGALLAKRRRQPLIPSGPDAPPSPFGVYGEHDDQDAKTKKGKSPFKKKELDGFRAVLIAKRRELAGDVAEMERGMASQGDRGGDPALDVAEQGSDAYGQSLSIGLAEADRKLIREIDDALRRIDDGVYGLCEVTHEPIGIERLRELPWARLSIEAARAIERRGGVR